MGYAVAQPFRADSSLHSALTLCKGKKPAGKAAGRGTRGVCLKRDCPDSADAPWASSLVVVNCSTQQN